MFGRGIYFADTPLKSLQYTGGKLGGCVGGDTELGTAGGDEGGDGRLGVMDTGSNCVVKSGAEAASQSSTAPQIAHCGLG